MRKENLGIKTRKGCIKQYALVVEKNARFHLSQQRANQNIVQNVIKTFTIGQETVTSL